MRKRFILWIAIGTTGCQPASENGPSITELCQQTVRDYVIFRDDPDQADAYAQLFTENGTFELAGQVAVGHQALKDRHRAAHQDALWRHDMTDIRIVEIDGGLEGVSRFVVHTGPKGDRPGAAQREIIGQYRDIFELSGEKCYLKQRRVEVVFDTRR